MQPNDDNLYNYNEVNKPPPPPPSSSSSWKTNVALGLIGTSFVGTIFLISPFITMQLRSPLPYMATPRHKVINALKEIVKRKKNQNALSSNSSIAVVSSTKLRYYDLGSGDGETVLAASSQGWKATGIELNSTLWALSSFRRLMSASHVRKNSNFVLGNMWKYNIKDADAVMIFGVKPLMSQIANKIQSECKPGTYIMSYRFLIPTTTTTTSTSFIQSTSNQNINTKEFTYISTNTHDDTHDSTLNATLIYDKDEMRIYQLLRD